MSFSSRREPLEDDYDTEWDRVDQKLRAKKKVNSLKTDEQETIEDDLPDINVNLS